MPDGHDVGMDEGKCLSTECGVPQVGIATAIDHCRTADDHFTILGDIEPSAIMLLDVTEEGIVRNVSLGFQPVVMVKQLGECLEIVLGGYLLSHHATGIGMDNALVHLVADALFWCMAVKGVVDAHPVDREEMLLAELPVAKHLLAEVTNFQIEHAAAQTVADGLQHQGKQVAAVGTLGRVGALAQDAAMHEEIGREPRSAITNDGQQLS